MTCDFCNKKITRRYLKHDVCEFHYLKQNPIRNVSWVLLKMRDRPPYKIIDRRQLLKEIRKTASFEEIESYLSKAVWYRRIKDQVIQ